MNIHLEYHQETPIFLRLPLRATYTVTVSGVPGGQYYRVPCNPLVIPQSISETLIATLDNGHTVRVPNHVQVGDAVDIGLTKTNFGNFLGVNRG